MRTEEVYDIDGVLVIKRWFLFRCPWFRIMLHRIYRGEKLAALHGHEWHMLSVLLRDWYVERLADDTLREVRWWNWKRRNTLHRVGCAHGKPLTLCFGFGRVGPIARGVLKREQALYDEQRRVPQDVRPL